MDLKRRGSAISGIMITAGTAIGAGMFSLPVAASGMWFLLSLMCLLFLWFLNYLSALYILEANVQFEPGASFNTIITKLLGEKWNILIGLSIAFLMYILLYAYFSAFGNIATQGLGWETLKTNQWLQGVMSLLLGGLLRSGLGVAGVGFGRLGAAEQRTQARQRLELALVAARLLEFLVALDRDDPGLAARARSDNNHRHQPLNPWLVGLPSGATIGMLSGIVGIGGGIFLSPLLHVTRWAGTYKIAAACSAFILFNSIAGLSGQLMKQAASGLMGY